MKQSNIILKIWEWIQLADSDDHDAFLIGDLLTIWKTLLYFENNVRGLYSKFNIFLGQNDISW